MFQLLYAVAGLAFVGSLVSYWVFCAHLSQDIQSGRIAIKVEA